MVRLPVCGKIALQQESEVTLCNRHIYSSNYDTAINLSNRYGFVAANPIFGN